MDEYKFTISIEVNGNAIDGTPIVRRLLLPQGFGMLSLVSLPDSNTSTFHSVTAINENPLVAFMLTNDQPVNLNLNQLTALPMNANGVILIIGANLTQATPSQNVEFNNPSATTNANLGILAGGT